MLNNIKYYLILILMILICIIIILRLRSKSQILADKLANTEYNQKVSKDTIRISVDEYNKLAYLTDNVNSLLALNKELSDQVKSIQGNVSSIIHTQVKVIEKPVPFMVTKIVKDSLVTVKFSLDTTYSPGNYKKLSGFTEYNTITGEARSQKLTDEIGVNITTGIKNLDKGKPEIFLKSDYPGLTVTHLDGAVLDPKLFSSPKKTPLITPGITIGWTPVYWNNGTQKVSFSTKSIGITAGLSFNILKLFKK